MDASGHLSCESLPDCLSCPIRTRAVCARCAGDDLDQLEAFKLYRRFAAGEAIARAGERLEFVGSIVTGAAALTTSLDDGRRQVLGLLLPSDFLGRPGRDTLGHDVIALTDVEMCCFQRPAFDRLLDRMPHLHQRLLDMALDDLDAARAWMTLLGCRSAREKVAGFLVIMVDRQPPRRRSAPGRPAATIDLPMARDVIADYLGLTLETVSRQFGKLAADDLIGLDGSRRVKILDLPALIRASGAEAGDARGAS